MEEKKSLSCEGRPFLSGWPLRVRSEANRARAYDIGLTWSRWSLNFVVPLFETPANEVCAVERASTYLPVGSLEQKAEVSLKSLTSLSSLCPSYP